MAGFTFKVEIISTQTIKPSTPTPLHLQHFPLTRLDQLLACLEYHTPLVLFYSATTSNHSLDRLQTSLSNTLSLFYPCGARLSRDLTHLLCNDDGVPLVIARVKTTLTAFLGSRNKVDLLPCFLPPKHVFLAKEFTACGWVPQVVQLTLFECGGVAIGSHVLHNACIDGITWSHFFKTWAAINAGRYSGIISPDLMVAQSLFPPCRRPHPVKGQDGRKPKVLGPVEDDDKDRCCVVKAFYFSHGSIKALQSIARSKLVPNPTRVETVSGFLWKHLMAAAVVQQQK